MRIAHLSDPHFGTEVPEVVRALTDALQALAPAVIVVSGDITQRARSAQFDAAQAFLDSLPPVPKLLVPGNHDLPLFNPVLRLFAPRRTYHRAFGSGEPQWVAGSVAVIGIDSTLRSRHTRGTVGLDRLDGRLRDAGDASLRLVVAHHPLQTLLPQDRAECLIGARQIAAELSRLSADMVLSGHVHMPLLTDTRMAFPGLPRHFVVCGAGTAVSARIRSGAPNSFNLVDIDPSCTTIRVERRDFSAAAGSFGPVAQARFMRAGDGWRQATG